MGTIPHALIAAYEGDTTAATIAFDKHIDGHVNRIVLVDWNNDVIGTSIEVAKNFYKYFYGHEPNVAAGDLAKVIGEGKNKIWAVRFDTSGNLRDKSVIPKDRASLGVNPEMVWRARKKFDQLGMNDLKIMVSGGFDAEKIDLFETLDVPADLYGVGSKLLKEKLDFTADVVEVNGKECAKVGRKKGDFSRLTKVEKKYWE